MKRLRPGAVCLSLMLASCFPGSEFPPSASAAEVDEILAACRFAIRSYEPQERGGDHLVVNIYEDEPDHAGKARCLQTEAEARGVGLGSVGPLPARRQGS